MIQLILHLVGDYVTQSDWMAQNKRHDSLACFYHAALYSFPFSFIGSSNAWFVIFSTHFLIDRFGLARYVVWAKNWLSPRKKWYASAALSDWTDNLIEIHPNDVYMVNQPIPPFWACSETGYPPNRSHLLSVWLLIAADNTMHLAINYAALRWL